MKITVLCIGKSRAGWQAEGEQMFADRLQHYCDLNLRLLRESKDGPPARQMAEEAKRILAAVPASASLVAMDATGQQMGSEKFSQFLLQERDFGNAHLCFAIGGAFGLDATLKRAAKKQLSLSKMTLPHELARVHLLEQLYRGFSILRGEKYHK